MTGAVTRGWAVVQASVRHAARRVVRRPARTLVSVAVLGLGIGILVTALAVRESVLTAAAPYAGADRLVWVGEVAPNEPETGTSQPMLRAWSAESRMLAAVAGFTSRDVRIGSGPTTQPAGAALVTASLLQVLQVSPVIGRDLTAGDDLPDAAPVALISHRLWHQWFGGRPDAVGDRLDVDGVAHRVIGVLPAEFAFPRRDIDLWLSVSRQLATFRDVDAPGGILAIARLSDRGTPAAASAELERIAADLRPGGSVRYQPFVRDLRRHLTRDMIPRLRILLAVAVLVLVLASANVGNLAVADLVQRRGELSVKAALGASRGRILGEVAAESLLIVLSSCVAGLLLAMALLEVAVRLYGETVPELAMPRVGGQGVAHAFGALLVCSLLVTASGLAGIGRAQPADSMRAIAGGQSTWRGGAIIRDAFTATALCVTVVLLIAAGTLGRSFLELSRTQLGFAAERVVTARVALPYMVLTPDNAPTVRASLTRLLTAPEFAAAGLTVALSKETPSRGNQIVSRVTGGEVQRDLRVGVVSASSSLFSVLGIPMLRGASFRAAQPEEEVEFVVATRLAARLWPGENPIGRTLTLDDLALTGRVVGVAGDVRQSGATDVGVPQVYVSYVHLPLPWMTLLASTDGDLRGATRTLQALLPAVDPSIRLSGVQPLSRVFADSLAQSQFYAAVVGLLAVLSVALTLGGLYSVLALFVAQRRREIGIRMSLGATPASVLSLVLRRAMTLAAVGAAAGLVIALMMGTLLRSLLFGVSPADPAVIVGALTATVVIAAGAALVPARRATLIDPARAVRAE